jgi:hypothetical protein
MESTGVTNYREDVIAGVQNGVKALEQAQVCADSGVHNLDTVVGQALLVAQLASDAETAWRIGKGTMISHGVDDLFDPPRSAAQIASALVRWRRDGSFAPVKCPEESIRMILHERCEPVPFNVDRVMEAVHDCAPDNFSLACFALTRMAVGAAMVSPEVEARQRKISIDIHDEMIVQYLEDEYSQQTNPQRDAISTAMLEVWHSLLALPEDDIARSLGVLTTKSLQEFASSSFEHRVSFADTLYWSLLYSLCIYFQNSDQEELAGESVSIPVADKFDHIYEQCTKWRSAALPAIQVQPTFRARTIQALNVWRHFEPSIQQSIGDAAAARFAGILDFRDTI